MYSAFLLIFTLQACSPLQPYQSDSKDEINQVAARLASEMAEFMTMDGKIGFAVFPLFFESHSCLLGEKLATCVQKRIRELKPEAEAVISEQEMESILDSISIQNTDPFDQDSGIPALGQLFGHRYEITGKMFPVKGAYPKGRIKCWIQVRIRDLQNGITRTSDADILTAREYLTPISGERFAMDRDKSLHMTFGYRIVDPDGLNRGIADLRELCVNDRSEVRFFAESDKDVYAYLFSVGSSGEGRLVFPNPYHPSALIRKGERVTILPETGVPHAPPFTFDREPGSERFFLVASLEPPSSDNLLEKLHGMERIRIKESAEGPYVELQKPLSARETDSLVTLMALKSLPIQREVMVRNLFNRIREGEDSGRITTRDLALRPPTVTRIDNRDAWEYMAKLMGTEILVEEFKVEHR